jgi:hypothetical protein
MSVLPQKLGLLFCEMWIYLDRLKSIDVSKECSVSMLIVGGMLSKHQPLIFPYAYLGH